ncbi:MAG: fructosamine kinase family protein [Myxococcota bacterium]
MHEVFAHELSELLQSEPTQTRALSGGDINEAFDVTLADGRRVFVKGNRNAPRSMFAAEAKGLSFLRVGPLRIPKVVVAGSNVLVLEFLSPGTRVGDFDELLGRGLAELHRNTPASFGADHDNFIGRLPQRNTPEDDWATFYREHRLRAELDRAGALVPRALRRRFDDLFARLDSLVGPPEPPARLHGDLWGGNLHRDERGQPCLIDPAVYGGHREVDLAMMRLFGGFSARVFDAYQEAYPLAEGAEERVSLYQLYPLLVHVNLFGAGYLGSVDAALRPFA